MTNRNPLQSYRQVSANTASPGQLVVMLYDGAIKFLERALAGFDFDDPLEFNSTISNNVLRAQQILSEMNSSLDMERGGEISGTLRRLYDYMDRLLTRSNLHKTRAGIEETIRHLTELRSAWKEMLSGAGPDLASTNLSLSACV
jgi:flagellar protein FliS